MPAQFGSLDDALLKRTPAGNALLSSAGPVSDAFILSTDEVAGLNGPVGSAKTTASCKKALVEATRLLPWDGGRRTYVLGVYREKYDNLWKSTIPSWWTIFPQDFGTWNGSRPRSAEHVIDWRDQWGDVRLIAQFSAFGEQADPEDARGLQITDGYLNEMDLLPEDLFTAISARVGRRPMVETMKRPGRIFGDFNAPDVTNWVYRDFFEDPKPGFKLYRQPGGLHPDHENPASGRMYYESIINKNLHRPWYIRRMVHNKPGFTRDTDVVFPEYDDDRHRSRETLPIRKELPIIVGIDGGGTPAAVYQQHLPNGQMLWLAEIALTSSGMIALSEAMLALEATPRFRGCEFYYFCDPAMHAGHETQEGSDRQRLSKLLRRSVSLARTNDPKARNEPIHDALKKNTEAGEPCLLLDPSLKRCRRGFSQTFAFHRIHGTDERGRIRKTPDSHPMDAGGYAAMETGQGHSRLLKRDRERERQERMEKNRHAGRFNPFARRA